MQTETAMKAVRVAVFPWKLEFPGNPTAWLRPFLNSLTWRGAFIV